MYGMRFWEKGDGVVCSMKTKSIILPIVLDSFKNGSEVDLGV